MNRRLDRVINKVTSLNQKAYNKERYIQEALINTIDAVRHCEVNGISGAILSIDQKKAFDSVFHGYMLQVYRFYGFGEDFIKLLQTIGTGRNARVILDGGKYSREIDLDRGFAQGDGPSPRLYNIGEQILIFRLEYDPRIMGIYVSFLIPRQVIDRAVTYPLQVQAEEAGLRVDPELRHNNRRIPAFADDANGAFKRDAENLTRIKNVLQEFGRMSGLETNVDKTTLMPIGNLQEPITQEVRDLGFEIVSEIKCLGLKINNTATNLSEHFNGTISKVRQLIGMWGIYNLSLGGKIAIAKTMLISQIGYIGCIVTPTAEQVTVLQNIIDSYVTNGNVVAEDRLYTKPNAGGLGLIKLSTYITALQCSWVKRCSIKINDSWRWELAPSCNFCFDNLRPDCIDKNLHPVLGNIVDSFCKLQNVFLTKHDNYLQALLVDNPMFLRADPRRRAPVRGSVDRNLLGAEFYDNNKERLRNLRMNCLIRGGRVADYNSLCRNTNLVFPPAAYLNLVTAANFAIKKYGNVDGNNGTRLPTMWMFGRIKKGSVAGAAQEILQSYTS